MTSLNGPNSLAAVMSMIETAKKVRIETGNIHRHSELFKRIFKNSAEELVASIQFQLEEEGGPSLNLKLVFLIVCTDKQQKNALRQR